MGLIFTIGAVFRIQSCAHVVAERHTNIHTNIHTYIHAYTHTHFRQNNFSKPGACPQPAFGRLWARTWFKKCGLSVHQTRDLGANAAHDYYTIVPPATLISPLLTTLYICQEESYKKNTQ